MTRPTIVRLLAWTCLASAWGLPAIGETGDVASSVHNLSVSGPGEVRALDETEICKFCHIPHNSTTPVPMWGQELSKAQYQVPQVRVPGGGRAIVPQPDGASRLCLSCHDGTVALGDVAGEPTPIPMSGSQRLSPGRPGFIGTDLSGSHPVSFVVPDGAGMIDTDSDMGLRPLSLIRSDDFVRLDERGKMQCTTCHDPHSDKYYQEGVVPRFWVKPSVGEVCITCHELR